MTSRLARSFLALRTAGSAIHRSPSLPHPLSLSVLSLFAGLLSNCATIRAPEGGPADIEGPKIVETDPPQGATRVRAGRAVFRFNEYVDRQSFQNAVHISPLMRTPPLFDWSGNEVEVEFQDSLRENRTYVVTVGSSVKDKNAGNPMPESFSLAFSTGDSLDAAACSGAVFDEKAAGVAIFAYRLDGRDADTLNPSLNAPDYAVETGNDGSFRFSNLAVGRYRLLAVRDKQKNYLYDIETDDIGIPEADIAITGADSLSARVRFRLTVEDTTAPYLQTIQPESDRRIAVKWSEEVTPELPPPSSFLLRDSTADLDVLILSVTPVPNKKYTSTLIAGQSLSDGPHFLSVRGIADRAGIAADETRRYRFTAGGDADTIRPGIISSYPLPRQSAVRIDSAFRILFSLPMRESIAVSVIDSSGRSVALSPRWHSATELRLEHPRLPEGVPMKLCIDLSTAIDQLSGRAAGDSLLCFPFTTDAESQYGSITGTVKDDRRTPTRKLVRARDAERKADAGTAVADTAGKFSIAPLAPGKYFLDVVDDADGNGRYSPGSAFPFRGSERFSAIRDTIRVRARWETSGVNLDLP